MSYACSLVIPTKNGSALFRDVVQALQRQTMWLQTEFIVIDSGSTDGTLEFARAAGAHCITIAPEAFNHGATRDQAIAAATCERIVLMVQD